MCNIESSNIWNVAKCNVTPLKWYLYSLFTSSVLRFCVEGAILLVMYTSGHWQPTAVSQPHMLWGRHWNLSQVPKWPLTGTVSCLLFFFFFFCFPTSSVISFPPSSCAKCPDDDFLLVIVLQSAQAHRHICPDRTFTPSSLLSTNLPLKLHLSWQKFRHSNYTRQMAHFVLNWR